MNERKDLLAGLICVIMILAVPVARAGEIRSDSLHSAELGRVWHFHVYLPAGYDPGRTAPYPVLYLLHGSGGDEGDWDGAFAVLDTLIEQKDLAPVLAFAPGSGTSWWVDGVEAFESAFYMDLMPYVERRYPIDPEREAHIIVGFSMGGWGALHHALAHPEHYAGAILLSPALYAEQPPEGSSAIHSGAFGTPYDPESWERQNYPALMPSYLAADLPVRIFIGAGDDDWNHTEGRGFNMEIQCVRFYSSYHRKHGQPAELRIVNGGHDWDLWLPLFRSALLDLGHELEPFQAGK